ncbi:MAG: AarF/UbiB family protein [Bacteriovorax sp.]|nr:AarF/UbiB family protein [Bacteriovorax sp.]
MKNKLNRIILLVAAITLLATSCSTVQNPVGSTPTEYFDSSRAVASSEIDPLIAEFKTHLESKLSVDRKAEIKTVQENLLKYLIEATNSDDSYKIKIYNDASNYFNKIYPVLLENIRTEKKGDKTFTAIKSAPIWTLKDELNFLNAEVENLPNPKIKVDLIQGLSMVSPFYKNLGMEKKAALGAKYDKIAAKILGAEFDLYPSFTELEGLVEFNVTHDEKILQVVAMVEGKLKRHELAIRNIGSEIAKSGQVDMKNTQIKLVVKFMDYYFNKLPSNVIKTIMSELVTAGPKMTEETVMNTVFQNTGPGLGKVLQQIGKEKGVGENFSKLMGVLESNGKQVPIHLVRDVVSSDLGGFEIKSIVEKPLGTGTIAQVNKATMVYDDIEKVVAMRFLKPGVGERCKEDIAILRHFVPDNEKILLEQGVKDLKMMGTLIDSVEKFLDDEVDLSVAVERQKKAFDVYTRSVKVSANPNYHMLEMKVPEVYLPPNGKSNLHMQEFVTGGAKFSELTDVGAKKVVAEEMLRMWFEEALFQSGYLNADLHQGNFRVVMIEEDKKIKVLLYDFGLSSTLSKEDQRAFLLVGAGAYLKSPATITNGLMVSMNSEDATLRATLMKDIEAELKKNPGKQAEDWVGWCVQKNYFVSDKLGAFARGSLLLKQLPESIGETEMFKDIVVKSAVKNLVHSIADRNYDYPLTKIDLVKLAAIRVKNSCLELFQSFFKN